LRCCSCGTAITAGAPAAELHESGAYAPGTPRLHRLAMPALRAFDAQRLALLAAPAPSGGRLLDAGAGRGRFVAAARAAGYDARGIEPSARGVGAAVGIGAPVEQAAIEEAVVEAGSLDAVTLWHVLEHLPDPGVALGRIAGWLRPGGALLVGVPNLASWQARLGAERWYHLDVPRHRVHFTPTGLDALLRTHGFVPVRTTHVLLEHNPFGMWQSLVNRLTSQPSYLYNLLKRNAPLFSRDLALTLVALPLAPLAALAELAAGLGRRGGTIAVLARRGE
jgi:SAM-dependent methyltransferase